jgi:hypothetical protein
MLQTKLLVLTQQIQEHLVQQLDLELRQFFLVLQLQDQDQQHHLLEFLKGIITGVSTDATNGSSSIDVKNSIKSFYSRYNFWYRNEDYLW